MARKFLFDKKEDAENATTTVAEDTEKTATTSPDDTKKATSKKTVTSAKKPSTKKAATPQKSVSSVEHQIPETPENTLTGKAANLVERLENSTVTKAFDLQFIPRKKLVFYEENDYPQENIEQLADKILRFGLIHNLEVVYNMEEDTYSIDSGERRCRALDYLIETYKNFNNTESKEYKNYLKHIKYFENGYPCNVKRNSNDDELDKLYARVRNRIANEEVRDYDPARKAERIAELKKDYIRIAELEEAQTGTKSRLNINKEIAKDLNISERQVKKYNAIQKLIPELRDLFNEKKVTLTDGNNYAQLSEEEQKQIYELIKNGDNKKEIDSLYQSITKLKKDMAQKEDTIETLETEKAETQKELENAKQELVNLQKQLEEEAQKEAPNTEEIEKLKSEIANSERAINTYKENHAAEVKKKDEMISKLKKELKEKKSNTEIPAGYQESLQLKMQISELQKVFASVKDAFNNYKSVYSPEEPVDQSPNDFKKQITDCVNDLTKILK